MDFFKEIEKQAREKNSLLCVGLDPRVDISTDEGIEESIFEFNKKIIDATEHVTVCYKPNIAFYESYGIDGHNALVRTIEYLKGKVPVLLDAKRNDIGATAEAYAKAAFDILDADAITLSPYMGKSSADPFFDYEGKGYFFLCRTSNEGAGEIQELEVNSRPLFIEMANQITKWNKDIGLVVAGNDIPALKAVRSELSEVWMLSPGIGAQGGTMYEAIEAGLRADGLGILPVVARAISGAKDPKAAAEQFCAELNQAREKVLSNKVNTSEDRLKQDLLKGLIDTECFRLGEFVLKSGIKSPFYVDLRKTSADPKLMKIVGKAYARLMEGLEGVSVAGIPVAAISLATVASLETGLPMIYPRMNAKSHGTGNMIEGKFAAGDRVILLDDLITTGKSKIEAVEILRGAGLIVEDLVVLLERGAQGRKDMEAAGIRLHSFAKVEELFDRCLELSIVDKEEYSRLVEFAAN
ncbi:MAG: orotidine-5'-phosphate decarboxylase [Spirochaetales bacterium]|nr:orotidine-5'-phosphate decarboxylase [Spirochaetales bacterium]